MGRGSGPGAEGGVLLARAVKLERLQLHGVPWANDAVLRAVATLPRLRELDLSGLRFWSRPIGWKTELSGPPPYTGAGIAALGQLAWLERLELSYGEELPVAALRALADLPLRWLELAMTPVDYDAVTPDKAALRALWPAGKVYLGEVQRVFD